MKRVLLQILMIFLLLTGILSAKVGLVLSADIDEPMMGLSPLYVDRVLEAILEINKAGISVFMLEQNANLALQIAHFGALK